MQEILDRAVRFCADITAECMGQSPAEIVFRYHPRRGRHQEMCGRFAFVRESVSRQEFNNLHV
jgi:hypothetical protein